MSTKHPESRSDTTSEGRRTREAPPTPVEEALQRAERHGRRAVAEALAGARALLDALALATRTQPRAGRGALGLAARALDALAERVADGEDNGAEALWAAVLDALDAEIVRWEARASDDAEARAVMRAFLGLKEILWELGVLRGSKAKAPDAKAQTGPRRARAPRHPVRAPSRPPRRVERVPVEG